VQNLTKKVILLYTRVRAFVKLFKEIYIFKFSLIPVFSDILRECKPTIAFFSECAYTVRMLKLRVVAVGGIKESFYRDAVAEYVKRLGKWCKTEIEEVAEAAMLSGDAKRTAEGEAILKKLKGYVCLLDVKGKKVSSEALADKIQAATVAGNSELTFVIGGSNGVSDAVKARADETLSFGDITLPHQLFRVVLLEQLYRAQCILHGTPYHK